VTAISFTNGTSGYTSAPSVIISGGSGTGAAAEAALKLATSTTCSGGAAACYPPAVNYTPLYYLINGAAFDKTNATASLFNVTPAVTSGQVLVRMVNAGLRMHIPSIVGAQTGASNSAGFSLIAEDGNLLPDVNLALANSKPLNVRVQSEVFLAAGKTYDVLMNVPAACTGTGCTQPPIPMYDRQLSLSSGATNRDSGMLAYLGVNGSGVPSNPGLGAATANPDTYNSVIPGQTLSILDPSKGVIANDVNVYGVQVQTAPTQGTLTLNPNGTFTYVANSTWTAPDTFAYCANGGTAACATVTLNAAPIEAATGITCTSASFTAKTARYLSIARPGILAGCTDEAGYPLTVDTSAVSKLTGQGGGTGTLTVYLDGSFTASVSGPDTYSFTYNVKNSQGTGVAAPAAKLTFPAGNGPSITLWDGTAKSALPGNPQDYRWIIEEDRTFYVDPTNLINSSTQAANTVPSFGTSFHTSYMPVVAEGCTGQNSCENGQTLLGAPAACDYQGICSTAAPQKQVVKPSDVVLDTTKRYYLSVLPGDAIDASSGHAMGGASIIFDKTKNAFVTADGTNNIIVEPLPLQPAKVSVFVYEDDYPLNGEYDTGGGVDVMAPYEAGLGQFNITLWDDVAQAGDAVGQLTYDMFNQPLSNALAGTLDPVTGKDACPISVQATNDPTQAGITGEIPVCPKYEADGTTLSPLAGHAVIANLPPGRYGVVATPGADRIGKGEEWLQTNTLDGQKAHDAFIRVGEPAYFQEFGPAGYHVSIGFANPAIINGRWPQVCTGGYNGSSANPCNHTVSGRITGVHMSRTPDERLYSTGSRDIFSYTQCFVSLGEPDGPDFAFAKCDANGNFTLPNIPTGNFRISVFDQWNDQIIDGYATPLTVGSTDLNMGDVAVHQWKSNLYTRTFFDKNGDGKSTKDTTGVPCTASNTPSGCNANYGNDVEDGLALVKTHIRYRDGSFANLNNTDLNGYANFNETFPLFNWYVVETDTTRFKSTGTHVVYDTGGPVDTTGFAPYLATTTEPIPLPTDLRFPGSVYCISADCTNESIKQGAYYTGSNATPVNPTANSTGRLDPPWVETYGYQSFSGQGMWLEFGKAPYSVGENGGISGHVVYASTRPFDDPSMLVQNFWEPLVPHVTINLYQQVTAPDGTTGLKLVDSTQTSSWDDWAQGYRTNADGSLYKDPVTGNTPIPNISCPGQSTTDPFFFTIKNQQTYFNSNGPLPYNSQYKCYDGMHNWNQLQPAPYDGVYKFPSIVNRDSQTGRPVGAGSLNNVAPTLAGTNCTICTINPFDNITPMLPPGKYQVEVVVPPGYELVKEEDKNILTGDAYIAPVQQEFGGLSNVFILPDQATIASSFNSNNAQNATNNLGAVPRTEGDTPDVEEKWPCVGQERVVPDYLSIFPTSQLVAPFAGATRNLCDRKEVMLEDQRSVHAKFYIFTSAHVAAHLTGIISDDFSAEFDPFSPAWGEKFSPPNMPVSIKDWAGNEVQRIYSDQWGTYNALTYSTWGVNPPDPSGYVPQMMVTCMNDRGAGFNADPLYQPNYSQFCYELSFMPGETMYGDTPVIPTTAFADGFNHADCAYPDTTPAIASVSGDVAGPWVSAAGKKLTVIALGDQMVENNAYSGPSATTAPFNQKKIKRHYGFGSTAGTVALVGPDGVPHALTNVTWGDLQITGNVPAGVPNCALQQQLQPGAAPAQCGQLVITASNGKQSIDSLTVTIGGTKPTVLAAGQTIQSAIDAANPGDLIIVPAGTYHEMLLMWKPVRLQGVGAASVTIDASTDPSGQLLEPWRRQVVCLFGLALNGRAIDNTINSTTKLPNNPYDPTGTYTCPASQYFQVDRLPLEATVGWDASLNGNLAEQLQEPTIMGAYEGAGITVLGKGVSFPDPTQAFVSDVFPAGTTLLTAAKCGTSIGTNPHKSNFYCNPSRIDGLSITDSSQGGGGIFVHGWAHNLEISNNRIYNNQGTLAGGMVIGQGEHPPGYVQSGAIELPGSCETTFDTQYQMPYCFNTHVNIHNNDVSLNSSEGDELFSSTPAGAGGIALTSGADYYRLSSNWVCGNMSTGDGGGVSQLGFVKNADIEHNTIIFNQTKNPTIPTNGGGLLIMGAPDTDAICSTINPDTDCPTGLGDGAGPGMVINANLIQGNSADSGAGGGLRLQHINGSEVSRYANASSKWYSISITNNIITNNVAGWDGAGVSLQDALLANFINNTITANDSTAASGTLFQTFRRDLASSVPPGSIMGTCDSNASGCTASARQPAGISVAPNSPYLIASFPTTGIACPANHPNCKAISDPVLNNNVVWHNRSFHIELGPVNAAVNQTSVTLTPQLNQSATGACDTSFPTADYWDLGIRGDLNATNHGGTGLSLRPLYSVLSPNATGYDASNLLSDPVLTASYCNGSKVPPEFGGYGFAVPPGTDEGNVYTNHYFSLMPGATTDESNNWINLSWGPLAQTNLATSTTVGADPDNPLLNNSALQLSSPALDRIPTTASTYATAPTTDFFGNPRPDVTKTAIDIGAIEYQAPRVAVATVTPTSLSFSSVAYGQTSAAQTLTVTNTGNVALAGGAFTFGGGTPAGFARATGGSTGNCGATLAVGASCTYGVVFSPGTSTSNSVAYTRTLAIAYTGVAVTGSPVALSGTGVAMIVTPQSLTFTNVPVGTTSAVQNLTVRNSSGATRSLAITVPSPFTRSTGGCGTTLANNSTCTIGVAFSPAANSTPSTVSGSVTITTNGGFTVSNAPVPLSGTSVAVQNTATLTPATWGPNQTRNCPGTGLGVLACTADPSQAFTLTNTGNVTLTGISAGALTGANTADFTIVRLLSNCGTAAGQLVNNPTLAPGATCVVRVQFKPLTAEAAGTKTVTLTVSDSAGSQTGAITGTAN
jgi:hypothetical protein